MQQNAVFVSDRGRNLLTFYRDFNVRRTFRIAPPILLLVPRLVGFQQNAGLLTLVGVPRSLVELILRTSALTMNLCVLNIFY